MAIFSLAGSTSAGRNLALWPSPTARILCGGQESSCEQARESRMKAATFLAENSEWEDGGPLFGNCAGKMWQEFFLSGFEYTNALDR